MMRIGQNELQRPSAAPRLAQLSRPSRATAGGCDCRRLRLNDAAMISAGGRRYRVTSPAAVSALGPPQWRTRARPVPSPQARNEAQSGIRSP